VLVASDFVLFVNSDWSLLYVPLDGRHADYNSHISQKLTSSVQMHDIVRYNDSCGAVILRS